VAYASFRSGLSKQKAHGKPVAAHNAKGNSIKRPVSDSCSPGCLDLPGWSAQRNRKEDLVLPINLTDAVA
jgi:hypothetical protein